MQTSFFTQVEGEAATVAEALRISNLDAPVVSEGLYGARTMEPLAGFKRIAYEGHQNTLAVTKERYQIVQNVDALGIIDDVLGMGNAQISTVGYDKEGARVFVQAKMPHSFEALAGDQCDQYLTVTTSHDGTGSVRAFYTAKRAFCQNQMSAIRSARLATAGTRSIAIRHNGNAEMRVKTAHQILMSGSEILEEMREFAEVLARKSNNRERTKKFLEALFPSAADAKRDHNKGKREAVAHLIEHGKGNTGATAWDLYNGATEWFDHQSPVRGGTDRTARSILGGDNFRNKVAELALSI